MSRPHLYSRVGHISSPTEGIPYDGSSTSEASLERAKQFSLFALQHVEEVRQALISTADKRIQVKDESTNQFGDSKIALAFEELTAAYDKLSSLKWDVARKVFEDSQRASAGLGGSSSNGKTDQLLKTATDSEDVVKGQRGVKEHPWQEDEDDDDMDPTNWIGDAFLKSMTEEEGDDGEDTFPVKNGNLSLNATANSFSTPPGFNSSANVPNGRPDAAEGENGNGSANTKPTRQHYTSISEISSLHTRCSEEDYDDEEDDDDEEDSDSDYSDTSSSEESLPPMENFDYLYKGGFVLQVSGGKETKGVVPKTVKHVLVDPSCRMIDDGAFQGCNALESVTIPSSVETVGDNAFRKCSKLKNVTFLSQKARRRKQQCNDEKKEEEMLFRHSASTPSSVSTSEPRSSQLRGIGEWAFFNCSSLAAVTLPHGLQSIGARAFQRCSMVSITGLPETLSFVGENAFVGCPRETKAAYERWEKAHLN